MKIHVTGGDAQLVNRLSAALSGAGHSIVIDPGEMADVAFALFPTTDAALERSVTTGVERRIAVTNSDVEVSDATEVVRSGLPVSRHLDPFALEAIRASDLEAIDIVHADDLIRMLTRHLHDPVEGAVTAGTAPVELLRKALRGKGTATDPAMGTAPLGWSVAEALEDLRRGAESRRVRKNSVHLRPGWIPLPQHDIDLRAPAADGAPLHPGSDNHAGEFDGVVDDRFPVYTATNAAEALPGALTPMTIDVQIGALRFAGELMADLFGFGRITAGEWIPRVNNVFAHRVWLNASVGGAAAALTPGWDEDAAREQTTFVPEGTELLPRGTPDKAPTRLERSRKAVQMGARFAALFRRYPKGVQLLEANERRERIAGEKLADLSDAQLAARLRLAVDRNRQAWAFAGFGVILASAAATTVEKKHGKDALSRLGGDHVGLESAQAMVQVNLLADVLRARPNIRALVREDEINQAITTSPDLAAALETALERVGHRGPGEGELANQPFAERPEMLLGAAARAAEVPPRADEPREPLGGTAARIAVRNIEWRERGRSVAVHTTNQIRGLAREVGRRAVDRGALEQANDVFYLTIDELLGDHPEAKPLVGRRRAERERLAGMELPSWFSERWEPKAVGAALGVGGRLVGIAASPGTIEGRVRIVTDPGEADLEAGEILVASVTDVGYTPLFAAAGAVVTDIGALMSHAAIVAREFGIACVVQTETATSTLRDGQLVRVDGTAGTVEVLAEPDPDVDSPGDAG